MTKDIPSVENQKGAIYIQRCSVEHQKGAIAQCTLSMAIAPFWLSIDHTSSFIAENGGGIHLLCKVYYLGFFFFGGVQHWLDAGSSDKALVRKYVHVLIHGGKSIWTYSWKYREYSDRHPQRTCTPPRHLENMLDITCELLYSINLKKNGNENIMTKTKQTRNKTLYRVAPKKRNSRFSGLCSDQQLPFSPCWIEFPHYNNTKIIKFGWEFVFYE